MPPALKTPRKPRNTPNPGDEPGDSVWQKAEAPPPGWQFRKTYKSEYPPTELAKAKGRVSHLERLAADPIYAAKIAKRNAEYRDKKAWLRRDPEFLARELAVRRANWAERAKYDPEFLPGHASRARDRRARAKDPEAVLVGEPLSRGEKARARLVAAKIDDNYQKNVQLVRAANAAAENPYAFADAKRNLLKERK